VTHLYLASTSPARKKILTDIGLDPRVIAPDLDEEKAVLEMSAPKTAENVALHLATLKAESVLSPDIDGLVIGGDSVFELEGTLYGKPHTPEVARQRWQKMVGNQGTLYSGLWLIDHSGGTTRGATGLVSSATLQFANDITPEDIEAYIQTGEPLSVAGAFTLDGRAAAFIESIQGDPLAVVGLSAYALRQMVQELGYNYTELWGS
jgi:septum formation protein